MSTKSRTTKAGRARAYHHGDLRRALLDRAAYVVSVDGASGLVFSDLARSLGVTHAAVYRHFRDKEQLVLALADDGYAKLTAAVEKSIARASRDPRAAFLSVAASLVAFAHAEPGRYLAMFSAPRVGDLDELGASDGSTPFGMLLAKVRAWQTDGLLGPGDPMKLAVPLWALSHGLASLSLAGWFGDEEVPADVVEDAHEALLDGLRAGRETPPRRKGRSYKL